MKMNTINRYILIFYTGNDKKTKFTETDENPYVRQYLYGQKFKVIYNIIFLVLEIGMRYVCMHVCMYREILKVHPLKPHHSIFLFLLPLLRKLYDYKTIFLSLKLTASLLSL